MELEYTFELMGSGNYQVRLCGEFVCYSQHKYTGLIDDYLKREGFNSRKEYYEACIEERMG